MEEVTQVCVVKQNQLLHHLHRLFVRQWSSHCGFSYCSATCPCSSGKGDCDSNSHCAGSLICCDNIGNQYSCSNNAIDICLSSCSSPPPPVEIPPCSVCNSCGDCNSGNEVNGVCDATAPPLPSNEGDSCSPCNSCGDCNTGTISCGSCSANAPDPSEECNCDLNGGTWHPPQPASARTCGPDHNGCFGSGQDYCADGSCNWPNVFGCTAQPGSTCQWTQCNKNWGQLWL